jgi:hypothetical protein
MQLYVNTTLMPEVLEHRDRPNQIEQADPSHLVFSRPDYPALTTISSPSPTKTKRIFLSFRLTRAIQIIAFRTIY